MQLPELSNDILKQFSEYNKDTGITKPDIVGKLEHIAVTKSTDEKIKANNIPPVVVPIDKLSLGTKFINTLRFIGSSSVQRGNKDNFNTNTDEEDISYIVENNQNVNNKINYSLSNSQKNRSVLTSKSAD
jgi:hypothetical protein